MVHKEWSRMHRWLKWCAETRISSSVTASDASVVAARTSHWRSKGPLCHIHAEKSVEMASAAYPLSINSRHQKTVSEQSLR